MANDVDTIAFKIIDLAKATALADNHFLAAAIGKLELSPGSFSQPLATNGHVLGVDSQKICLQFKHDKTAPKHDLMHSILHCIFLHPYISDGIQRREWNIACDIAAEQNVIRLCGPRPGSRGFAIQNILKKLTRQIDGPPTAEKIYQVLLTGKWSDSIPTWEEVLLSDDHILWYDARSGEGSGLASPNEDDPRATQHVTSSSQPIGSGPCDPEISRGSVGSAVGSSSPEKTETPPDADIARSPSSQISSGASRGQGKSPGSRVEAVTRSEKTFALNRISTPDRKTERQEWRRIAKTLAINLQTYAKRSGKALGGMVGELEESTRDRIDYSDFLRQFAIPGEVLKASEDEFDYIFYTYGLKLYGNLPLIEPLEYRIEKRIREFVIVIDTSGSVYDSIVRDFIGATFDILKSTEAFFERIHLRIIQCDASVQCDDVISSLDELRQWGRQMRIYGCGGTDFRPAFAYVDELIEQGAFENLGGLIYFTDGMGVYPEWTPSYKVAFVFYDNTYRPEKVPPWAAQIVLDDTSIPKSRL